MSTTACSQVLEDRAHRLCSITRVLGRRVPLHCCAWRAASLHACAAGSKYSDSFCKDSDTTSLEKRKADIVAMSSRVQNAKSVLVIGGGIVRLLLLLTESFSGCACQLCLQARALRHVLTLPGTVNGQC